MITLAICSALFAQDPVFAASEADAYTLEYLKTPDGCVLEVGGMDFLSDGRLVVSTRRRMSATTAAPPPPASPRTGANATAARKCASASRGRACLSRG